MKFFIAFFLTIFLVKNAYSQSQLSKDMERISLSSNPSLLSIYSDPTKKIFKETRKIMRILNFQIRPNIKLDSSLIIRKSKYLIGFNSYLDLGMNKDAYPNRTDSLRYYLRPVLLISSLADSIINKKLDTNYIVSLRASSFVVHELTHYFQVANSKNYHQPTSQNDREYYIQRIEFEAFSVQSYYFLEKFNKKIIKVVFNQKIPFHRKCELLIDEFRKIVYPSRPAIFTMDDGR